MPDVIHILVVEDEVFIAMALRLELRKAGYAVDKIVNTGEEAVAHVEHTPPDVILMDIRLAGELDGIEAAQQIRARHAIPIIFLTGYQEHDQWERAQPLQPAAYFVKPVSLDELRAALDSVKK